MSGCPRPVRPRFTDVGRLVVRCPDRPGIVAVLSGLMAEVGANITDSQQHSSDPSGGTFTLRLEFCSPGWPSAGRSWSSGWPRWRGSGGWSGGSTEAAHRPTLAVFVSRTDHVLQELIYRVRAGDLRAEIACVVSNHRDLEPVARGAGIPFHHVPVTPETKAEAEARGARADRRRRPGRAGPLHADRVAGLLQPVPGAADQHPPQLPAGVRRREPVPGGARPRGEADRGDGALRDRRSSTPGRSSSRRSPGSTTARRSRTCAGSAATSSGRCSPRR